MMQDFFFFFLYDSELFQKISGKPNSDFQHFFILKGIDHALYFLKMFHCFHLNFLKNKKLGLKILNDSRLFCMFFYFPKMKNAFIEAR